MHTHRLHNCFQGSFWVRTLLPPQSFHLLIHHVFIPVCLFAVIHRGYSGTPQKGRSSNESCAGLMGGAVSQQADPPPGQRCSLLTNLSRGAETRAVTWNSAPPWAFAGDPKVSLTL